MGALGQYNLLGIDLLVERLNRSPSGYYYKAEELSQTLFPGRDPWIDKSKTSGVSGVSFLVYRFENEEASRMPLYALDKSLVVIAGHAYLERGNFKDGRGFYEYITVTFECPLPLEPLLVVPRLTIDVHKEMYNGGESFVRGDYRHRRVFGLKRFGWKRGADFRGFLKDEVFLKKATPKQRLAKPLSTP